MMQRNHVSHSVLVGMYMGTAFLENSLAVSSRTEHVIAVQPSDSTLGHVSQKRETYVPTGTCT